MKTEEKDRFDFVRTSRLSHDSLSHVFGMCY